VLSNEIEILTNTEGIHTSLHNLISKLFKTSCGDLSDEETLTFIKSYAEKQTMNLNLTLQFFRHFINWYKVSLLKPLMLSHLFKNFKNCKESQKIVEFIVEIIYNVDAKSKLCQIAELDVPEDDLLDFPISKTPFHRTLMKDLTVQLWLDNPSLFWCVNVLLIHTRFVYFTLLTL